MNELITQIQEAENTADIFLIASEIGGYLSTLENSIVSRKGEIKKLQEEKKVLEKNLEEIKHVLLDKMQSHDIKTIRANNATVSVRSGRECVDIVDAAQIPEEYIRVKKEVDKRAIMKFYTETGIIVPGVKIKQGKNTVSIKENENG